MSIFLSKDGTALVTVMLLSTILLITAVSLTFLTGDATFKARKTHDLSYALAIAEAGVADVIQRMSTNYYYWIEKTVSNSFYGGSYVAKTSFDTNTGHVIIRSRGSINNVERITVLELLGTLWDLYNSVLGTDGAIIAGGSITLSTSACTINGSIMANGNIIKGTGNPTVNGDIIAVGSVSPGFAGSNTVYSGAAPVIVPTYNLQEWYVLATNGGLYFKGNQKFAGVSLNPGNGVVYVDGNVEVVNRSSLKGTLVVTGTITVNNRFDHSPFNTNWPALLAGIDIYLNNRNNYYGIIWAGNNIYSKNRRYVYGALIAKNNVYVENDMTLDPIPFYPAWSPTDSNKSPPEVVLGGWLQ